jgi:hypothetical protein
MEKYCRVPRKNFFPAVLGLSLAQPGGSLNSSMSEGWRTTGPSPALMEGDMHIGYMPARATTNTFEA